MPWSGCSAGYKDSDFQKITLARSSSLYISSIGQSIAVTIQCSNGYGQHLSTLSTSHQEGLLKAGYAANLLFIASLCFVKLSIASFIDDLTPITRERQAARAIGPWDRINGSCINQKAFGNYYAAVNILTDFSLILMVVAIATHIQTSRLRRFAIMVIFGIRICVIAATGVQIYYLNKPSKDLAFDPWPEAIITQIVLCLSILTACLPYLKPFLSSLESGMIRADDLRRRGQMDIVVYNHYPQNKSHSSGSKKSKVKNILSNTFQSQSRVSTGHYKLSSISPENSHSQPVAVTVISGAESGAWDRQSRESQTSQTRIIRETRSWNVELQNTGLAR
ncbi:hypothetical protein BHYA_0586g00020 [Botrytis hyacinthi]|uniref:Rhodopsin domain-containing protein n=1 Tax=Botrytis hyacinthi TaxID=278943 RepID=A0A4Z1GBK0_9HELO|nr:hypothetical protein BHYA_0586g00020 [Botrytis hyacinthi]